MAPIDVLHRILSFYRKDELIEKAVLPPSSAAALSILYTFIYVIPFYLSEKTRPSARLSRDAPSVIRARIRAVSLSCVVTSILTLYLAVNRAHLSTQGVLHLLGWWPVHPLEILKSIALAVLLFIGPLFESAIAEGQWREWLRPSLYVQTLASCIGWRNYVAGPITEEVVFRSLIIPLHLLAKVSTKKLVFVTPLYFGIAHLHHFYEFRLTHPHVPMLTAVLRTVVQFSYTSLFGFYTSFLFLRTGSLPAVILTHSFCNCMGLPRFWGRVEAPVPLGPQDVHGAEGSKPLPNKRTAQVADGRLGVGWTITYYLLLVLGAYAFYRNFWHLTSSDNALVKFERTK